MEITIGSRMQDMMSIIPICFLPAGSVSRFGFTEATALHKNTHTQKKTGQAFG